MAYTVLHGVWDTKFYVPYNLYKYVNLKHSEYLCTGITQCFRVLLIKFFFGFFHLETLEYTQETHIPMTLYQMESLNVLFHWC